MSTEIDEVLVILSRMIGQAELGGISPDVHADIKKISPKELALKFTGWWHSGCRHPQPRLIKADPHIIASFISEHFADWTHRGQDQFGLMSEAYDFKRLIFTHDDEDQAKGATVAKKRSRLLQQAKDQHFRLLTSNCAVALVTEPGQLTLGWIYENLNFTSLEFGGDVYSAQDGHEFIVTCNYIHRKGWELGRKKCSDVYRPEHPRPMLCYDISSS